MLSPKLLAAVVAVSISHHHLFSAHLSPPPSLCAAAACHRDGFMHLEACLRLPGALSTRAPSLCRNMFAFACLPTAGSCARASLAGLLMSAFVRLTVVTQIPLSCIYGKNKLTIVQQLFSTMIVRKTRKHTVDSARAACSTLLQHAAASKAFSTIGC